MVIELDNSILVRNKLTAKEYLILFLLFKKTYHQVLKYLQLDPVDLSFWEQLNVRGWLAGSNYNDVTTLYPTHKFTSFLEDTDFFTELMSIYPKKVTRPDGEEVYLRVNQKICKNKYNRIIKNSRVKHEAILQCLRTEVAIRTKKNTLKYMKLLPNWLKDEEYKNYEGIEVSNEVGEIQTHYGDSLL